MAEAKSPWGDILSKLVLYVGVPVGVLVVIYALVTKLLTAGGEAFINLYKTQLDAYIAKMDRYAKENNGVLNAAQQASREDEQKAMNATLANAAQQYGTPWGLIGTIAAVLLGILIIKEIPAIYNKWKPVFEKPETAPRSGKGAATIYECVLVDRLAAQGFLTTATNFLTTIQTTWNSVDVLMMQNEIASLQAQINAGVLTGIYLQMAQYTIQAYQFEIAVMPSIFALPLIGV